MEMEIDVERETRAETLLPGDRFRWLGEWYTVGTRGVRPVTGIPAVVGMPWFGQWFRAVPKVEVSTTEPTRWGGPVSFLFPTGHFLAAEPLPRVA